MYSRKVLAKMICKGRIISLYLGKMKKIEKIITFKKNIKIK